MIPHHIGVVKQKASLPTIAGLVEISVLASDPRHMESGTSYGASGFVEPDALADVYKEIGSTLGAEIRDVVPRFASRRQAMATFEEMTNSDASTDVSLRAGKIPVQGADYYIEPYNSEPINLDIAEFIDYNLFKSPSQPFLVTLDEILRMFEYGFSVMEKVFINREWVPTRAGANRRKYTMLKKLSPRPAATVTGFVYDDNGGPVAVNHNAIRSDGRVEEVQIDIAKCIVFTMNKKGGSLEGKSILRTAYAHWYYKTNFYKIDAVQKERHGIGVPQVELPPGYTEADRKAAIALASNIRTNEKAYAVIPPGYKISFLKPEGQMVNVLASAQEHSGMIMLNVMAQFLILGLTAGGGRATASSQVDIFIKSLRYISTLICDYFNLYLIPQLVAFNFQTDKFPQMKVRNVGEARDLQLFAAAMANLAKQKIITMDDETENWVRKVVDMPAKLGPRPAEVLGPNGQPISSNGKGQIQTGNLGASPNSAN